MKANISKCLSKVIVSVCKKHALSRAVLAGVFLLGMLMLEPSVLLRWSRTSGEAAESLGRTPRNEEADSCLVSCSCFMFLYRDVLLTIN